MAKRYTPGTPRAVVVSIPAPHGGWNARDSLTAMAPTDALVMDNFIPDVGGLRLRRGYSQHATGVGSRVDTLMGYESPSGGNALFAAGGTAIYNATTAATATAVLTVTNAKFQHVMMGTPAGAFLVVCNGADVPFMYNGTLWATASITGCTAGSSTFINVTTHQSRLWFAQANTLDAWFLPTSSVEGAAQRLQLGPFCRKGGFLMAIASWTRDGGAGMDDQIVFITSRGEAVLYSGTDPTSATLFQKVGTFNIPEPVGRRCFCQVGADLALITTQGIMPLSAILPLGPTGAARVAATDKISQAWETAYRGASTAFGWQVIENPKERLLFVNVPVIENTELEQYVMNTKTGAWCRFLNINAQCWGTFGDTIYFGSATSGIVYKYGSDTADNSAAITAEMFTAFSDLGNRQIKQFVQARAMVQAETGYIPGIAIRTDYDRGEITIGPLQLPGASGTPWDTGSWDTSDWGVGSSISTVWQTVGGAGISVSIGTAVSSVEEVRINAFDIMGELGDHP